MRRAVFLDRDNTINADPGYLSDPAAVRLLPGALAGLRRMQAGGLPLILISNQAGVGRGYFDQATMWAVHGQLVQLLEAGGVQLAGAYYCPHTPWDECPCRKPAPGMLFQAAREHEIDLKVSFMIGDKPSDVEAGRRAGCRTVLIGAASLPPRSPFVDTVCPDLTAAAAWILGTVEV
ncbi:MAG: HAD family hydrolase [Roseiflexaceae bacterium]|nr:HAD family hydrolase [Roseiflexaceae bacterium]